MAATDYAVDLYLKNGLNRHYGFDNHAKILCIGHSRSMHGIDSERLERALGVSVSKYAVAGTDTFDRLMMVRHYLSQHPNPPNIVVYDVDYFTFNGRTVKTGQKNDSYKQFFPFIDNAGVDRCISDKATWSEYLSRKLVKTLRYNDPNVFARAVIRHFQIPKIPNDKIDIQKYKASLAADRDKEINLGINPDNVKCFEETMELFKKHKIKVVLLHLPIIDLERDRINKEYRHKVVEMFRSYARLDKNLIYVESSMADERSYGIFCDSWHLNRDGQALITDNLANVLKTMI